MEKMDWLSERRQHDRITVKNGTLAVSSLTYPKRGHILNISRGGLAFHYVGTELWDNESFELSIKSIGNGFFLDEIDVKLISDSEVRYEKPMGEIPIRKLGVQFKELTKNQALQVEYLIQNYSL